MGIHIPYIFRIKWGASWSYESSFPIGDKTGQVPSYHRQVSMKVKETQLEEDESKERPRQMGSHCLGNPNRLRRNIFRIGL